MEAQLCYKCRFLVTSCGYLKRKNKSGPCDRCLNAQTVMQDAMEEKIWLKHIPAKDIKPQQKSDTK